MENTRRHCPPADFGPVLRAGRNRRGLGLREAARLLDLQPGYLSMLEHGKRSPSQSVAELLVIKLRLTGSDATAVLGAAVPGVGRDYEPD
jgi:transcriptional regulator with XRE-family HTH domain